MGLLRVGPHVVKNAKNALAGAITGAVDDAWKEFFYCDALPDNVLVVKGEKKASGRAVHKKKENNVITSGSHVAVADGQCMMIVENGEVLELCAEPGIYVYDSDLTPSIFTGELTERLDRIVEESWERFQFGGGVGKDQRIYYINTKEISGNKYGTVNAIPFRIVDTNIGLDIDVSVRCHGEYSYRIVNPMLFYKNVCGNVERSYTREQLTSILKAELLTALQPAFARISALGIRYSSIPGHTVELAKALNEELSEKWIQTRGIQIFAMGINGIFISPEDEEMIKDLQRKAVMRDPNMAAANLADAQAEAMRLAAANENGALLGFMGMGVTQQMRETGERSIQNAEMEPKEMKSQSQRVEWICTECGTLNWGNFCMNCGLKKPDLLQKARCAKCGWKPENQERLPRFCPECGNRFETDAETVPEK